MILGISIEVKQNTQGSTYNQSPNLSILGSSATQGWTLKQKQCKYRVQQIIQQHIPLLPAAGGVGSLPLRPREGSKVFGRVIDRSQISGRIYFGFLQASISTSGVDIKESQDRWAEDKGVWVGGSHSCLTLIRTKTKRV